MSVEKAPYRIAQAHWRRGVLVPEGEIVMLSESEAKWDVLAGRVVRVADPQSATPGGEPAPEPEPEPEIKPSRRRRYGVSEDDDAS